MSEKIKTEKYLEWGKTMTRPTEAIVISDKDLERLKNAPLVSIKSEATEKCKKANRECGYLNFFNDVDNLMKKYNIKSVRNLENRLKALEIIKKINKFNLYDLINGAWIFDETITQYEREFLKEVLK